MCMDIISDKHWLTENIICLLSNAVKYSNGGAVKIFIEHVQADEIDDEKGKEDCDGDGDEVKEEIVETDQPRVTGMKLISLFFTIVTLSHRIVCRVY